MEEMKSPPLTSPNTVTVRRNPLQKDRPTPSTAVPQIPTFPSKNLLEISSLPIDEILSIKIPQNPLPDLSQASSMSKNLNVFLRIRPLVLVKSGDQNSKPRAKNVWPKNPAKRVAVKEKNAKDKSNEVCITVDDSQSVTLSPPLALQTSKRIRSAVYKGFSYVFSAVSSQVEVYEKMLSPLVEEFLRGKSGMLAAVGPSGSGKTHTIFGSPGDPGMVSLALQRIFKGTTGIGSESRRSFYLSIFEIYYERGKRERMLDLSPNGGDLFMQQWTIKGLQEVIISDAAEAKFLISRAMLKRAIAMTNADSQSSRSHCIINIRSTSSKPDEKGNVPVKEAVLTIVDLAGAEREKRTGNQRSRLLESNFINYTSMIFYQCLRALLEHQKNPRKPLEKHFQNSLLTRYLRDYLEGKKRMTLILTVKSGGEDYLDTSYLLRQASRYMKIKFDNVEDPSNLVGNKRHFQMPRVEQPKRMKFSGPEACSEPLDSAPSPKKVASTAVCNNVLSSETSPNTSHKLVTIEKPKRRLMLASSILLRDISALDVEDEFEKPKGNRNGKRVAANEGEITQEKMSSRSSCTIYVGNLPGDTRMREVEDLFYKYGPIVDIDLKIPPRPPGYAFVEFEDYRDAEDAIRGRDGYNFDGYQLRVELAHGGRRPSSSVDRYSGYSGGGGSRGLSRRSDYRVLVTGLPSSASWQDLKDYMRRAGDVCFSQVFRVLGGMTGIVDYTTYDDMKYAIYKLDRSEFQNAFSRANVRVREYDSRRGYSRSRSRSPYYSRSQIRSPYYSGSQSRNPYHSRSQSPVYSHSYSGRKRSVSPKDKYMSRSPSVSPARPVSERSHSGSPPRPFSRVCLH